MSWMMFCPVRYRPHCLFPQESVSQTVKWKTIMLVEVIQGHFTTEALSH